MNYLISGDDEYLVKKAREEIIAEFLPETDTMNLAFYDSLNLSWQTIVDDATTFPFGGKYKIIIIENCWFLTSRESINTNDESILLEYLENPNPVTVFILCVTAAMDKRKTLVKNCIKNCKTTEIAPLKPEDFAWYIKKDLERENIKLSQECYQELINRLPIDLLNWQNELAKLKLYPDTITYATIDSLITPNIEDDVFKLSEYVLARKLKESLVVFRDLLAKNKEPIALAALLAAKFRLIYQVKVWLDQGYSEAEIASNFQINPYPVKLANKAGRHISLDLLLEILADFALLDYRFKNINCDRRLEFELLLLDIMERKHAFA